MNRSKQVIVGVFIISLLVWVLDLYLRGVSLSERTVIKEGIYITGVISFLFMGLIMLLSIRPKWLESFFGGMDKIYYLHKWSGIWAIVFAALHYLIELSKPLLALLMQQGARVRQGQMDLSGIELILREYRGFAKDLGDYAVYFLLAVLVLTLWRKFSYKIWRYIHKLMAPLFIVLAFHTVILAPIDYWMEPVGLLLAIAIIVGSVCALMSILGLIGRRSTFKGEVIELKKYDDLIEITCELKGQWSHEAGQYAFFKHDRLEGAHPFTISSADLGNNVVRFSIKELGDYTNFLKDHVNIGDHVDVEGPYGLFNYQHSQAQHQIWIGGGVGVTPFVAWLEKMVKDRDVSKHVDFYYCVRNKEEAVYANYLQEICQHLSSVNFHAHYSDIEGYLTADQLQIQRDGNGGVSDIWFCGPDQFAKKLQRDINKKELSKMPVFHQEIFQMR